MEAPVLIKVSEMNVMMLRFVDKEDCQKYLDALRYVVDKRNFPRLQCLVQCFENGHENEDKTYDITIRGGETAAAIAGLALAALRLWKD